jgi:hypothetical protein
VWRIRGGGGVIDDVVGGHGDDDDDVVGVLSAKGDSPVWVWAVRAVLRQWRLGGSEQFVLTQACVVAVDRQPLSSVYTASGGGYVASGAPGSASSHTHTRSHAHAHTHTHTHSQKRKLGALLFGKLSYSCAFSQPIA